MPKLEEVETAIARFFADPSARAATDTSPDSRRVSLRGLTVKAHPKLGDLRREAVKRNAADRVIEIEAHIAEQWLAAGTIAVDEYGNENTYYVDQFCKKFYCKNYPDGKWGERPALPPGFTRE